MISRLCCEFRLFGYLGSVDSIVGFWIVKGILVINPPGGYCPGLKVHISPYTYPGLALSCATASEVRTTLCTPVESTHTCSPTVAQISAFISCVEWPTFMQVPEREAREVSVERSSPAADCRSNCPGLSSVLERDQAGGSDS